MALRSRFLRITLIVVGVLAFAGYFAFSTFVFSPTESDYDADVSTLVPRDVDFFVAKSALRDDFSKLPRLALQDELDKTIGWTTWIGSPEYGELDQQYRIEEQLNQVREQLAQVGVDPLRVFGGRDLALAGYFRGPTLEQSDWTAYGRCNWMGKLAVAALSFPGLAGLDKRGLAVEDLGEVKGLSGQGLARPLYVTRIQDVAIVGTSKDLVTKSRELYARGGQESLGLSANYNDNIAQAHRTSGKNDLELYCDWRTMAEKLRISGRWPDPQSELPWVALLARVFQVGSLRNVAGTVGFDSGVVVDLHGDLSSETMTPFQKSLYRQRGRDSQQIVGELARIARPDSQIVAHLEVNLGDFLNEVYASLDSATRQLLDETLRSTGQFNNTAALITELDTLFKGRIGLIVRDNDYPTKAEDPPHNDVPVPAVAVVLWIEGGQKSYARIKELQHLVNNNQGKFGLQGKNGGKGVYTNVLTGGFEAWEFWSPFIDGTGHIAVARDADMYFISNSFATISDLLLRSSPTADVQRLSDQPQFTQLVGETLKSSNLFLWINPRTLSKTVRAFAERGARDELKARMDWDQLRAVEEQKVIQERFPGKRRGQLDPETQAQVNQIVNPLLDQMEERQLREQLPAFMAAKERQAKYLEMCSALLVTVALDPKTIDLAASAVVPLDK